HSLRKASDQTIGGLVDGATYFVADANTNSFTLDTSRENALTSGRSRIPLTNTYTDLRGIAETLTGKNTIGREGIDLTAAGTGKHQLVLDLTSTGSGTQQLEGVGG